MWEDEEDYVATTTPIVPEADSTTMVPGAEVETASDDGWVDEEDYTPTETEEPGVIASAWEETKEFFSEPDAKATQEYKDAYSKTKADVDAKRTERLVEEYKLDNELTQHRKKAFKDAKPMELTETTLPTFMTNRMYTTESMMGNYNQMKAKNPEYSKMDYYKKLEQEGATTLDIQNFTQASRGLVTSDELFGEVSGAAPRLALEGSKTHVVEPAQRGLLRTGLAMASVSVDIAGLVSDTTDEQATLNEVNGFVSAIEAGYEEEYGTKSFVQSGVESIPLIATMAYNPLNAAGGLSWTKLAFADSAYTYMDSRGQGYGKLQSGAHAVIAATVTKGIGKLADVSTDVMKMVKTRGNELEGFTKISDLPTKHQKQIRELQKSNGWSDDEVISMIKGYSNGLEEGNLNAMDSIRLMGQNSHNPEMREAFEESILYNRRAANQFLDETTERSQDIIKAIDNQSELGKIVHKNTLTKYGKTSINWSNTYNQAVSKGINQNSALMKRIKKNSDMFDDFDTGYHKSLIKKGLGEVKSASESLKSAAGQITEAYVGRHIAKMTGTSFFMNMSIPKFVTRLMAKGLPKSKVGALQDTFAQSLMSGSKKLNPMKLKQEIKKGMANMPDDKIDDLVEEILKQSQKSKRTVIRENELADKAREIAAKKAKIAGDTRWEKMSTEEAEILYRDLRAEEDALRMEREALEAEENALAQSKLDNIKGQEKEAKMISNEEKEVTKSLGNQKKEYVSRDTSAAKVTYKAKQADIAAEAKQSAADIKADEAVAKVNYKAHQIDAKAKAKIRKKLGKDTKVNASLVSKEIFGMDITTGGLSPSLAINKAFKDGTINSRQIVDYYTINPSLLGDGSYGVPKNVVASGIPQTKIKVPASVKAKGKKELQKPLAKQDTDTEIESRLEYAETGKKCKGGK